MSGKDKLREWIEGRIAEEQAKINALPFDPTPESIAQYQESQQELIRLGAMIRDFCPPPKPEPDPELEELLY